MTLWRQIEHGTACLSVSGQVDSIRSDLVPGWIARSQRLHGQAAYTWSIVPAPESPLVGVRLLLSDPALPTAADPAPADCDRRITVLIDGLYWLVSGHDLPDAVAAIQSALISADILAQGSDLRALSIARLDLRVDHCGYNWSAADLNHWVGRHRSQQVVERELEVRRCRLSSRVASLTIGARGAGHCVRVYCKSDEVRQQHPERAPAVAERWSTVGLPTNGVTSVTGQRVWRVEHEIGREACARLGVVTVGDLLRIQGRAESILWRRVCVARRHVEVDTSSRRGRCRVSPIWQSLTAAGEIGVLPARLIRVPAAITRLQRLAGGCLVSLAERTLAAGESWNTALDRLVAGIGDVARLSAVKRDARTYLRLGGIVITDRDVIARRRQRDSIQQVADGLDQRSARYQLDHAPQVPSATVPVRTAGTWVQRRIRYAVAPLLRLDSWVQVEIAIRLRPPRLA